MPEENRPLTPRSPTEQTTDVTPSVSPSDAIGALGAYRMLQRIGEGGMGEVFLAEQTEPVRRRVAIKVISARLADRHVTARFEAERQALAMMDHPAIAKVFDAGQTPTGRSFFVMEYIPGLRITDHCERHSLTTNQRVALFIKVCDGVQHAHQRAIMHRDLKPSNVLVAEQDGDPMPKIIDFGLAKALGHRLTDRTLHTQIGAFLGTPEYMSPEQAESSGQDVDTRTDVYSLGVMLYELLTGFLPFDSEGLRKLSYPDLIRFIREVEPPRPTVRLSTAASKGGVVSGARRVDAATLRREVAGDLEWIVMKAMEKDRTRRYGSPAELALDLRRHLDHEPVAAGPPSAVYRARKFVRRHRFGVGTAAAGVLLLVGFGVAMALEAHQTALERDRANEENSRAQRVSGFLENLFLSADPQHVKGKEVTVREVLDAGRAKVHGELDRQPAVQVPLLMTLGTVYLNLGEYGPARELLEETVGKSSDLSGPDALLTLKAKRFIAWLLHESGKDEEARQIGEELLARDRRALGEDTSETLAIMNDLSVVYNALGRSRDAEPILKDAIERYRRTMGLENRDATTAMNNLAIAYRDQGRLEEAEALGRQALEIQRRVVGIDDVYVLHTLENLSAIYADMHRYAESEALSRQAYETRLRILGPDHVDTQRSLRDLLHVIWLAGHRNAEVIPLLDKLVESRKRTLGPEDPQTLRAQIDLGIEYIRVSHLADAERVMLDVLNANRRARGESDPMTRETLYNLGCIHALHGNRGKALDYLRQARAAGFDLQAARNDADLASLRGDREFEVLLTSSPIGTRPR